MGFFSKIKDGLSKTRNSISSGITSIVNSFTKIDEDLIDELEEVLVTSDIGVKTSSDICCAKNAQSTKQTYIYDEDKRYTK